MKAVICPAFDGPAGLKIAEIDAPRPGHDEIRIAVHRASVNYLDLLITRGLYQVRPDLPYVVGAEGAGEVIEVGADVTDVKPGDRVAAFHLVGAFAGEMTAQHRRVVPLPDAVGYDVGCATLHNYATSGYALRYRGQLQAGETLVVHGATGGVGLAALDLGRLWGARVIACVGSDVKAALARDYGVEHVINYSVDSVRDRVLQLTEGRGADVIYDPVGGDVFDQSMRCIASNGRLLVVGFAGGQIPTLPVNRALLKNAAVVGVNTGLWPDQDPGAFQSFARDLFAWVASGDIRPNIARVLPLEQVQDAFAAVDGRSAQGRYVLKVR